MRSDPWVEVGVPPRFKARSYNSSHLHHCLSSSAEIFLTHHKDMYVHNTQATKYRSTNQCMNWMGGLTEKKWTKSREEDGSSWLLVLGQGGAFSPPVPGLLPSKPISDSHFFLLCEEGQEGVERFISSSLQCRHCPVIFWFLWLYCSVVKGTQNHLSL